MKHCHKLVSQKKLRAIPAMIHFGWLGFPFSELLLAATTCDGDLSTVPFVFGIIALTIPKIKKYCIYVRIMHTCIVVYVCTYVYIYIYIWCMHIYTIKPTELVWGRIASRPVARLEVFRPVTEEDREAAVAKVMGWWAMAGAASHSPRGHDRHPTSPFSRDI